jgi:hypothetical protein
MLYAGAVDETAMTTLEIRPSDPARRPLLEGALCSTTTFVTTWHRLPPGDHRRASQPMQRHV